MLTIKLVLIVFALVLGVCAGLGLGHPRAHLGWFGFACFMAAQLAP